jgi:hypothetical protein
VVGGHLKNQINKLEINGEWTWCSGRDVLYLLIRGVMKRAVVIIEESLLSTT